MLFTSDAQSSPSKQSSGLFSGVCNWFKNIMKGGSSSNRDSDSSINVSETSSTNAGNSASDSSKSHPTRSPSESEKSNPLQNVHEKIGRMSSNLNNGLSALSNLPSGINDKVQSGINKIKTDFQQQVNSFFD